MPDFIAKQASRFDYTKGIYVESRYIPDSMISSLRNNVPFDVWWVHDALGHTDGYRLSAKVRYSDFRLSRGTQYESWALSPDLCASFKVDGGIVDVPIVELHEQDFSGRYSQVGPDVRLRLHDVVDRIFGVSIIVSRNLMPDVGAVALSANDIEEAKTEVSDLLRRPLSSGHIKLRREFSGRLSGIGCAVLDSLERKGRNFSLAFAMAEHVDPLRRTNNVEVVLGKDPRNFRPMTLESILARTFSDPTAPVSGREKTQKAEEVHQEIVRRLFLELKEFRRFALFDSEFMDVGIFSPVNLSTPCHVIEVKSITHNNIESQVEKGLVQLARSQFYFGVKDASYHLVLQKAGLSIPDWLLAIAGRLNVAVHWIDLGVSGPDSCPGLFKRL